MENKPIISSKESDLAGIYHVETNVLNQAVKRSA